jgi:hypothetical protein
MEEVKMATRVDAILEAMGEDVFTENEEVISEMIEDVNELPKYLKAFVLNNPTEFIGESIEETFKNVRLFSEISTAQYMTELSHIHAADDVEEDEVVEESKIEDYL